MRYLTLPLLLWIQLFSTDSHTTIVTENDPSTLVEGVSVITGDYYFGEEEYVVAGAEPIPLKWFYLSRSGGISAFPHLSATHYTALPRRLLSVNEPNGTPVTYVEKFKKGDPLNGDIGKDFYGKKMPVRYRARLSSTDAPGLSNTSTGEISGKSQLQNQHIVFDQRSDPKGKSFSLYAANGAVRRYVHKEGQIVSKQKPMNMAMSLPMTTISLACAQKPSIPMQLFFDLNMTLPETKS